VAGIDRETAALIVPPDELTRALARLHNDAAGSLGSSVSHPKHDEEVLERQGPSAAHKLTGESECGLSHRAPRLDCAQRRRHTSASLTLCDYRIKGRGNYVTAWITIAAWEEGRMPSTGLIAL